MKNLIITPVGMPLTFDDRYDKDNHWRYTKPERNYETLVVVYNDFEPEPNTYDKILRMKGHKWQIIRELGKTLDLSEYNYIGCVDDDLITDLWSFNKGLALAEKYDFKLWQLSMPKDSSLIYGCLFNNPKITYSETNFIEMGSPFFRADKFKQLIDFISFWDLEIAWGVDKVFCDVLQENAHVVHSATIHQPIRDSYYDKDAAMREMNEFLFNKYPKIMKEHFGRDSNFRDVQTTINEFIV